MEENKQYYQMIINLMKEQNIIKTEHITKNQMEMLIDLFMQYYTIVFCNNSEIKYFKRKLFFFYDSS